MTKLTLEELNVASASVSSTLTIGNTVFAAYETNDISIGQSNVTSSSLTIGNVSITPQSVTTPALVLGGVSYLGGTQGGIIRYDEFTANGTWYNPLAFSEYDSSTFTTSYSPGLTYSWYNKTATFAATNESLLDLFFTTSTTGTTLGGTGTHSTDINWANVATQGAGGTTGNKPAYLPADNFAWMVEGYILAPETGTYTFGVDSDDAGEVYVNNQRVAHFYGTHGFSQVWSGNTSWTQQTTGTIDLVANTYYQFRARMTDGTGGDGIQVGWQKPSDASIEIIPANAFYIGTTTPYYGGLTGNEQVLVMAWGGGGGAGGGTTTRTGGGGGGCSVSIVPLSSFSNTCAVTIGAGGAGTNNGTGVSGGSTTLVVNSSCTITAYGGAGGAQGAGGGGGGTLGAGSSSAGGAPLGGAAGASQGGTSTYGGGGGTSGTGGSTGGPSIFGGGGGGQQTGLGGNSIYGAAGGSGESSVNTAAISVFGGFGGSNTIAPTTPGGGGGADNPASVVSNGARGEVRVWIIGRSSTTAGAPTYVLTSNNTSLYEGNSVLYTVTTTNIANNTLLYYTLNNSSTATSSDFTTTVNGSVIINGGVGTFALTANADTDVVDESFTLNIRTNSTTGDIASSNTFNVRYYPKNQNYGAWSVIEGRSATYTFTNQSIGTANTSRVVYALFTVHDGSNTNRFISGVTINGTTATLASTARLNNNGCSETAIYVASIPTGTTANVVATMNNAGGALSVSCALVTATNINATPYAVSNVTSTTSSLTERTFTTSVPAGGLLIAVPFGSTSGPYVWSNAQIGSSASFDDGSPRLVNYAYELTSTTSASYSVYYNTSGTAFSQRNGVAWASFERI